MLHQISGENLYPCWACGNATCTSSLNWIFILSIIEWKDEETKSSMSFYNLHFFTSKSNLNRLFLLESPFSIVLQTEEIILILLIQIYLCCIRTHLLAMVFVQEIISLQNIPCVCVWELSHTPGNMWKQHKEMRVFVQNDFIALYSLCEPYHKQNAESS